MSISTIQSKVTLNKNFINERFRKYRQEEISSSKGLRRWMHHLDQLVSKDEQEFLDNPLVPMDIRISLVEGLSRLNNRSGYHRAFIKELSNLMKRSCGDQPLEPIKVLDIGAGGGGLLKAIHHWSKRRKIPVELSGADLSQEFIEATLTRLTDEKIPVKMFKADACQLETIKDEAYDFVISSYMVHHIRTPGEVASFFSEVARVARKGWLIVDFDRRLYGSAFVKISASIFGTPRVLINDGVKSVRRAYTAREINFILKEMTTTTGIHDMRCAPHPLFPFWIVKSSF